MARLPKPRFNLKSPKARGETLIFMVFRYKSKRLLYSTQLSIIPKEWDARTQRPLQLKQRPDLWNIQHQLDDFESWCRTVFINHNYGDLSLQTFKERLDEKAGRKEVVKENKSISFFEFMDEEIGSLFDQGMRMSSLKPYKVHAGVIKNFAKQCGSFTYEDVDWDFRLRLIDWLATKNVKISYGNKTLGILRQLLERARRKKLHTNTQYQGSGWLITEKKAVGTKIILPPEELQYLSEMQLGGYLKKVRDLFLIGAGTGQRFSDYSRYQPHHFYKTTRGIPILSIISQKTEIPAKVPLNIFPWLIPLLEEYEYTSPPLSMQKLNDGVKILCKRAGFDEKVLVVDQLMARKPKVIKRYVPRYEEVTTHTCRRSFATNLYRMGYSLGQIMPMTGHTTEGHLRTYIGIDGEENANWWHSTFPKKQSYHFFKFKKQQPCIIHSSIKTLKTLSILFESYYQNCLLVW